MLKPRSLKYLHYFKLNMNLALEVIRLTPATIMFYRYLYR